MGIATGVSAFLSIGMVLLLILVAVLWVLMPFAIFGTKDLLRQLIAEQKTTNKLLQEQTDRAKAIRDAAQSLRKAV